MDRIDKRKILEAIADGKIMPEDFKPLITPMFIEEDKPGHFIANGKKYSQKQLDAYCERFEQTNKRRAAIGLPESFMMVVLSGEPGVKNIQVLQKTEKPLQPIVYPVPVPKPITEDIPVTIEESNDNIEAIKPNSVVVTETVKEKKQTTFNMLGEIQNQEQKNIERSNKMNQYKNINDQL